MVECKPDISDGSLKNEVIRLVRLPLFFGGLVA